jgi:hypothetical protein
MLSPELWDSSDNTEAITACRQQCQRRFACAQEALAGPRHLVSTLNGVIAGVAIPAQNEYGTSKAHKAALKRLETIAQVGRAASAGAKRSATRHQTAPPVDRDDTPTSSAAEQNHPSVQGQEPGPADELAGWKEPENTKVLRVPPGDWGAEIESCYRKRTPKGQVDVYGAARITGLKVATLRHYRQAGCGPKSWLTPGGPRGVVRYWVADIEAWMAQRQPRPTARAS